MICSFQAASNKHISHLAIIATLFSIAPAYATGSDQRLPLKEGWNEQTLASFTNGCVLAILNPARQGYYARAAQRGDSNPKPFPEIEISQSVKPMCACIGMRIAQTADLQEVELHQDTLAKPFIEDAMKGGQCKPGGILASAFEKKSSDKQ